MRKLKPEIVEERIANTFSLPKDVVMSLPDIHMIGNREIIIENYRGILAASDECIRIQTRKNNLVIEGSKLQIAYYTEQDMKICGYLKTVSFQ